MGQTPRTRDVSAFSPGLLIAVAAGGAAGALARYGVGVIVGRLVHGFPLATILVNVAGSFAMGLLVSALALRWSVSPELRALLAVGFLGAFTTFSTFSLDAVALAERKQWLAAGGYVAVSVILSIAALVAGLRLGRAVFS